MAVSSVRSAVQRTAVVALLVALLLCATEGPLGAVSGVEAASALKKIAVLSRNGARGRSTLSETEISCRETGAGDDRCQLSETGRKMASTLGSALRERYATALSLPAQGYDASLFRLRSVDELRNIAFAQLVAKGMYSDSLPLIEYVPSSEDVTLAMTRSWPSWLMRQPAQAKGHADDEWAKQQLGAENLPTLTSMLPADSPITCSSAPSLCSLYLADTWIVNTSAGAEIPPTFESLVPKVSAVASRFLWRLLGIDEGNEDDREMGPLAGAYLELVWSFFRESNASQVVSLAVVPASTLFAAYANLGYVDAASSSAGSLPYPLPGFGEALVLEYYDDNTVKALRFTVEQTPDASQFSFDLIPLGCGSGTSNAVALSTGNSKKCTVDEAEQYVSKQGAAVVDGQCYVSEDTLAVQNCDGDKAPARDSACLFYRARCPGSPCGTISGAIADPKIDYACQENQLNKNTPYLAATIVALVAPSLMAGAIAGFLLSDKVIRIIRSRFHGKRMASAINE